MGVIPKSLVQGYHHAQEFVFMSEVWLKSPKSPNLMSSSLRREGMKHRNFISGVKICFDAY